MTSRFEGYPLATLESMSRGCPVVSYDIKYGPREQITEGVDGFLVEEGEIEAIADRALLLIRDPDRVTAMSKAAYAKALAHDHTSFIHDWQQVLNAVVEQKAARAKVDSVALKVHILGYQRSQVLPRHFGGPRSSSTAGRKSFPVEFAGQLRVKGNSQGATLDSAVVTLTAICDRTGARARIPLGVRREKRTFHLSTTFDPAAVLSRMGRDSRSVRLSLRLVWQNFSWETTLARNPDMEPNYEVSFDSAGQIHLQRGADLSRSQERPGARTE